MGPSHVCLQCLDTLIRFPSSFSGCHSVFRAPGNPCPLGNVQFTPFTAEKEDYTFPLHSLTGKLFYPFLAVQWGTEGVRSWIYPCFLTSTALPCSRKQQGLKEQDLHYPIADCRMKARFPLLSLTFLDFSISLFFLPFLL